MCVPLAAVGIGMSLAGAGANYAQQSAVTSEARKLNEQMSARNQAMINASAANSYAATSAKLQQERIKAGDAVERVAQDALAARARVRAAGAEAGVGGGSLDALLNDYTRQEGNYVAGVTTNLQFAETQYGLDMTAIRIGQEGRLLNATPDYIPQPNLFTSALGAFTGALSTGLSIDSAIKNAGGRTLML